MAPVQFSRFTCWDHRGFTAGQAAPGRNRGRRSALGGFPAQPPSLIPWSNWTNTFPSPLTCALIFGFIPQHRTRLRLLFDFVWQQTLGFRDGFCTVPARVPPDPTDCTNSKTPRASQPPSGCLARFFCAGSWPRSRPPRQASARKDHCAPVQDRFQRRAVPGAALER